MLINESKIIPISDRRFRHDLEQQLTRPTQRHVNSLDPIDSLKRALDQLNILQFIRDTGQSGAELSFLPLVNLTPYEHHVDSALSWREPSCQASHGDDANQHRRPTENSHHASDLLSAERSVPAVTDSAID